MSVEEFFADDATDEDDSGLREAILRELGVNEKNKKRSKEIRLASDESSIKATEKKPVPEAHVENVIKTGGTTTNSSHVKMDPTKASNGSEAHELTFLRRREAELEGELRGVRRVLRMLFGRSEVSPDSELFLLKSEMKAVRERMREQAKLLRELKGSTMNPDGEKSTRRRDVK